MDFEEEEDGRRRKTEENKNRCRRAKNAIISGRDTTPTVYGDDIF